MGIKIFKVGDTVYSWQEKGVVVGYTKDDHCPVSVEFETSGKVCFTEDGRQGVFSPIPTLSFTPYEVVKTEKGFSVVGLTQERPIVFKKGDLVLVQDTGDDFWHLKFFVKNNGDEFLVTSCSDVDVEYYYLSYKRCKPLKN